jgi:asparagine synthase (glutamine-hydrolysing)
MRPWIRDPFGFNQQVYHPGSGASAGSIGTLLSEHQLPPGVVDIEAVAGYLSGNRLAGRTVLHDFLAVPPGHVLTGSPHGLHTQPQPIAPAQGDLEALLRASLREALGSGRRTALALSGGLDSALLLGLLREMDCPGMPAYILAVDLPGYGELGAALESAGHMQAHPVVVRVGADEFLEALPHAMRHIEEPLFNLHPIAKLLLARAMRRDGIEVAISGDGADQVLTRDHSADYLPLCRILFDAAGVTLHPPFLDDAVVAHLLSLPPDPDKKSLRTLGARYNLAASLVRGPKRRTLAPPMALGDLLDVKGIAALARAWGMPAPGLGTDSERVQWTTLLMVLRHLGVAA